MTAYTIMQDHHANDYDALASILTALINEHRDIDEKIATLEAQGQVAVQLDIQRLKKHKLRLKDQIALIKSRMLPDIIA